MFSLSSPKRPKVVPGMPNQLHEGLEPKKKKKARKTISASRSPALTGMVCWEDEARNEIYYGTVVILCADGTVWQGTVGRPTNSNQVWTTKGKKIQTLIGLPEECPDSEEMARVWRWMFMQRPEHAMYGMIGAAHLLKLEGK